MEKYFKLEFVYPDGHIEEIFDVFHSEEKAKEYGNSLLVQVQNTEGVKRPESDSLSFKKKGKPYYMVYEYEGEEGRLIFESKH